MALEKKLRQRRDCLVAFHQCVALVLRCALPAGPRAHAASPSLPPTWRPFQSARKVSLHQPSIGCIIYGIHSFPALDPSLELLALAQGEAKHAGLPARLYGLALGFLLIRLVVSVETQVEEVPRLVHFALEALDRVVNAVGGGE